MLTPCHGREAVQDAICAALKRSRWVSIIGPPGSGKSLVARHVAQTATESVWVDARHLRDHDSVLRRASRALGVEPAPGDSPAGALTRAVDGRDLLLVLDGLDLDESQGAAWETLLDTTTDVRLLLTAVAAAGRPGEQVVRVGPLPIPHPRAPLEGPAVQLFLDRVRTAGGAPVDLRTHGADVRRLLSATGGLPLLIEQAAAQSALVGLGNATPAVSLEEAFGSAYDLLDDEQRRTLRRLGALDFGVGLGVLARVLERDEADTGRLVASLVRRSLVEVLPDGRFDMLSPIRRQALRLATPEDVSHACDALLRWADDVAPHHDNFGAADADWLPDLPAMRHAVLTACAAPETRALGYSVANRIYSSLYTSMRSRDALEILEAVVASGDGPPEIGAQVARRAGIAASEMRGTYEGLSLLDRSDEHAAQAPRPGEQLARTASIRAEMHLDAGALPQAEAEARRAIELDPTGAIARQATRTMADAYVSAGRFPEATAAATEAMLGRSSNDERWIDLSARTLLARIALEQGRVAEAVATTRAVVAESRELAEDRVGLIAETLLRGIDPHWEPAPVDRDSLPWAVRLLVLAQDARDLFAGGEHRRAAGLAADVVALADSARLGRDAVEARLLLGRALLALGEHDHAASTFLTALEQAAAMPMPLRAADALDGLASVAEQRGRRVAGQLADTAAGLRRPRMAVAWGYAATFPVRGTRSPQSPWLSDGEVSPAAVTEIAALFTHTSEDTPSVLDALTPAERQVAQLVSRGLTSRQIAEELYVSPRTVDAHLTHIYRKLGISTRARLAALVAEA